MLFMLGLRTNGGSEVEGMDEEEEAAEEEEEEAKAEELGRGPFPVVPKPTDSGPEEDDADDCGGGNIECSASPNWDRLPAPPPSRG